jgi:hypothetical protein
MILNTFFHEMEYGWSVDPFPPMEGEQTLVFVFCAPEYESSEHLATLVAEYPGAHVVGCSTAGEIQGVTLRDRSLSVAVVQFDRTQIHTTKANIDGENGSFQAGCEIAKELSNPGLRAVFILAAGTNLNGSELVRGLNDHLPQEVSVTGGLAGDGERFQNTWVVSQGDCLPDMVLGVGLYGEGLRVGHGSFGGWDIFGPDRRVTRSVGNVLYELDGKPALQLYKEYLGNRSEGLPAAALRFPLSLRPTIQAESTVVRTILSIDEAQQSMIFAGDIPEGYLSNLMKANSNRLIDGASQAAVAAMSDLPELDSTLSIAISCVGRRMVLGARTEEELEVITEVLPKNARQVGFYSYGELSPCQNGLCDLHNQTMTITIIAEE